MLISNRYIIIILLFFLQSFVLYSQTNNSAPPRSINESDIAVDINNVDNNNTTPRNSPLIKTGDYIRLIITLIIVIIIIYFLIKFIRKISIKNIQNQNDLIKILGSKILYNDQVIHLIEVEGLIYCLGSSSGQITIIDKITDKEIVDRIILNYSQKPETKTFSQLINKKTNIAGQYNLNNSITNFIKKQSERLKNKNE